MMCDRCLSRWSTKDRMPWRGLEGAEADAATAVDLAAATALLAAAAHAGVALRAAGDLISDALPTDMGRTWLATLERSRAVTWQRRGPRSTRMRGRGRPPSGAAGDGVEPRACWFACRWPAAGPPSSRAADQRGHTGGSRDRPAPPASAGRPAGMDAICVSQAMSHTRLTSGRRRAL